MGYFRVFGQELNEDVIKVVEHLLDVGTFKDIIDIPDKCVTITKKSYGYAIDDGQKLPIIVFD